ncbi:hypothetical protein FJT64_014427 [Amphibalanus amphitrite]|uniref:Uncharacterized protein n=1 Tax=Amphibalanus amphitrite TaxID=1232801 RepID=A0A6A4V9Y1_AMPAM|nr:hypothetical protein FJT64_014427 [Amphibalanus amphitrite]
MGYVMRRWKVVCLPSEMVNMTISHLQTVLVLELIRRKAAGPLILSIWFEELPRLTKGSFHGEGDNNQDITINCSPFSMESHSSCAYDYLSINERKYCGSSAPPATTVSELRIRIYTDYSDATAGQFPWQAGLVSTGSTRSWCGGSVINNRYTYADVTAIASGYGRVGATEPQATHLQHVTVPANWPDVYGRVTEALSWIATNTADANTCTP